MLPCFTSPSLADRFKPRLRNLVELQLNSGVRPLAELKITFAQSSPARVVWHSRLPIANDRRFGCSCQAHILIYEPNALKFNDRAMYMSKQRVFLCFDGDRGTRAVRFG